VLAPFDPNHADSLSFRRLGLPAWMVKNILKYRAKGGVFRKAADFRKIYGLSDNEYAELQPYITIAPREEAPHKSLPLYTPAPHDSVRFFKYPVGTHLSLNRSDTTELKKVPGIGSSIARMIVGYRNRLGGFYRIEQLADIGLNTDSLRTWFTVDTLSLRRIKINNAGIEQLRAHPYINFYQAKALVEYRKKYGYLHSLAPFALYEEFTPNDLQRIGHYLSFE
jgi:DNA uptake protein ComE-like DNA-binding protein